MKTTLWRTLLAMLGLLTIAGGNLPAQTLRINVQLTFQVQDLTTLSGDVYYDRVEKLKITDQQLLDMLATAYVTNFPYGFPLGARLMLVDYDHFQVQADDGSILVRNTVPFLTYTDTYAYGLYLFKGNENTSTGARNHTFYFGSTIQFDNFSTNGIAFTINGASQEQYSLSSEDAYGQRTYKDSLNLTATGQGTNSYGFFTISGRLNAPTFKWIE
jgi:hypothetical protein